MKALDRFGSAFLRALVQRMRDLGLTQSALARRMKCSRAYISKVFSGNVSFTFHNAARFAHALGMDFIPGLAEHKDDTTPTPSPSTSTSSLDLLTPTPIPNS